MRRFALLLVLLGTFPLAAMAQHGEDEAHVASEEEASSQHEEAHLGHMDMTFLWSVINFAVLFALLVKYGGPKISAALVDRRRSIAEALEEAQALKAEAEKRAAEYKDRLARLDAELGQIREDMVKAGEAERDRIVAEAEKKAARVRRETEFLIEQRMKTLREEVTREAVESALAAAEKVLVEKTTAEDQQRISRAYLQKLADVAKEGRA